MSGTQQGNGKVFISHAHEDNEVCKRLAQALDSWGVDYWFDLEDMEPGWSFISKIERELEDRDILLCVGTPAWSQGFWTTKEYQAYLNLVAQEHVHGQPDRRTIITLKMDLAFHPPLLMAPMHYIDLATKPEAIWPTELKKVIGATGPGPVKISELRKRYRDFFQDLMGALTLKSSGEISLPSKPSDHNWCTFSSGFPGIVYGVVFPQGNKVRTELYIGGGDEGQAKAIFDQLERSKSEIEREFGEPLSWERLNHRQASRIAIYCDGSIFDDPRKLATSRDWAAQHLITFKRVFTPRLQQIVGK